MEYGTGPPRTAETKSPGPQTRGALPRLEINKNFTVLGIPAHASQYFVPGPGTALGGPDMESQEIFRYSLFVFDLLVIFFERYEFCFQTGISISYC